MPTERCAKLMVVGMVNNLDEVWISENPSLLMVYSNQYMPNLFRWYVAHCKKSGFVLMQLNPTNSKPAFVFRKMGVLKTKTPKAPKTPKTSIRPYNLKTKTPHVLGGSKITTSRSPMQLKVER